MLATLTNILREMLRYQLYKKTQGKIVRQCTAATIAVILFGGVWQFSNMLVQHTPWVHYGVPALLAVLFLWFSYRIVNLPQFADFLIQVEAEMRKVSWPSTGELINSSIVVIVVMFFLAGLLFGYDILIKNIIGLTGQFGKSLFQSMGIFG